MGRVCLGAIAGLLLLPSLLSPRAGEPAPPSLVDLHLHFDHGMGFVSSGRFDDRAPRASWSSRYANKVTADALDASELGLAVVALYVHPVLGAGVRGRVLKELLAQIRQVESFVKARPGWVIARDAAEARRARARGKRILVLSLEGASPALLTEHGIRELVDRKGVSIVTFAHLADDSLSGAALMGGYQVLANPLGRAGAIRAGIRGPFGELLNPKGLTGRGERLAATLIRRGVWIDLAHSSEATQRRLIPLLAAAGQPLLYSHVGQREHHRHERALSRAQLEEVARTGGVVGLVPAESFVGKTPNPSVAPACSGGVFGLAAQFNAVAAVVGAGRVFIGSDFNGAMDHLRPSVGKGARRKDCALGSSIDRRGLADVGQTPELWRDLEAAGAVSRESRLNGVDRFLDVWARVSKR